MTGYEWLKGMCSEPPTEKDIIKLFTEMKKKKTLPTPNKIILDKWTCRAIVDKFGIQFFEDLINDDIEKYFIKEKKLNDKKESNKKERR